MNRMAYKGVNCAGHSTYPSTNAVNGSSNVYVNNKPVFRNGDSAGTHCNTQKPYDCHGRVASGGSSKVYVNGKRAMRDGDSISCGGNVSGGSSNVYVG